MTIGEGSEKFASALLRPINPAAIIILGVYTVVWGFWLANPFWSVFSSAMLYSALANFPLATSAYFSAELFWGVLAICCGSVTTYGAIKRKYKPLIVGSLVAAWHWGMIGLFYFAGDWMNTGGITSLVFCVYAIFIWLNIKVNHQTVECDDDLFMP